MNLQTSILSQIRKRKGQRFVKTTTWDSEVSKEGVKILDRRGLRRHLSLGLKLFW